MYIHTQKCRHLIMNKLNRQYFKSIQMIKYIIKEEIFWSTDCIVILIVYFNSTLCIVHENPHEKILFHTVIVCLVLLAIMLLYVRSNQAITVEVWHHALSHGI